MKKLILLAMVLLMVVGLVACGDSKPKAEKWATVRIGTEGAYPPFNYTTKDGKLAGFDVDIAEALCKEMGAKMVLVAQDWDGIIPALNAKKYDAIIASMSITPERQKKIAFSGKYYQTPARFIVKKGAMASFSDEAMEGKTVGVQRATIHDKYLTDNYKSVKIKRYGTLDEVYLDLVAGRLDMLLADSVVTDDAFLKKHAKGKDFQFIGPLLTDVKWFGVGAGIGIRKEDKDLVEKFNKAILAIRANGTYKKIQDKYFDFDVYGK